MYAFRDSASRAFPRQRPGNSVWRHAWRRPGVERASPIYPCSICIHGPTNGDYKLIANMML